MLGMMRWILLLVLSTPAMGREFLVGSAKDLGEVKAAAGDVILLRDGEWKDQDLVFVATGTAEQPVTLRAQTPGKVVLVGKSNLVVEGEYGVVSGLMLKGGSQAKDGIAIKGSHNRVTQCAVVEGTHKFSVHLFGYQNRLDHCYLAGKTSEGPTLQIEADDKQRPARHQVDHNHFGPRPPLGQNGGETIRIGYSHQSMNTCGTQVERNLFDRCDGELEVISNKSCANIYRFNTFHQCAGMLTLRHGNRCTIESNFFIGNHKKGSGGIRVIGEDHFIVNNYIEAVERGGVWITAGIADSPLNGYFQARACVIAFNTIVDSKGPCIELDAGMGSSKRTLLPKEIVIANNLLSPGEGGTLFKGKEGEGWKWMGNIAAGKDEAPRAGVTMADPMLNRGEGGLFRPANQSPVIGAAQGENKGIQMDIDDQPRGPKRDVGCDQVVDAPVTNRPLTASDVGPSWMAR